MRTPLLIDGKRVAYTAYTEDGSSFCVGIVTEGQFGYRPVPDYGPYDDEERAAGIVRRLNERIGIDARAATIIVASSMREPAAMSKSCTLDLKITPRLGVLSAYGTSGYEAAAREAMEARGRKLYTEISIMVDDVAVPVKLFDDVVDIVRRMRAARATRGRGEVEGLKGTSRKKKRRR